MTPASPEHIARNQRIFNRIAAVVLAIFYGVCAYWVVTMAQDVMTPCKDNFEGGCSMGKQMLLLMSLVPAMGAIVTGILLGAVLRAVPGLGRAAEILRALLIGAPALYLLWGVGIQFL